eukprot:TRINITY_DN102553_c0_g1_i1.p1 TRINITY_DN102553_c0_g1~~TRINITY_DN102553_c0_g1_i1.p1  ORF type:complete len:260 (+),score=93.05 TRINITY_DN102553_c0_g1_i1:119-898(+)
MVLRPLVGLLLYWAAVAVRVDEDAEGLAASAGGQAAPNGMLPGGDTMQPHWEQEPQHKTVAPLAPVITEDGESSKKQKTKCGPVLDESFNEKDEHLALDPMLGGVGMGVTTVNDEINAALNDIDLQSMRVNEDAEAHEAKKAATHGESIRAVAMGKMYKAQLDEDRAYWQQRDERFDEEMRGKHALDKDGAEASEAKNWNVFDIDQMSKDTQAVVDKNGKTTAASQNATKKAEDFIAAQTPQGIASSSKSSNRTQSSSV